MANKIQIQTSAARRPLRVGFVPLTDCAPLVMAHELGLFRKYGLRVALHRELGWATIRDKIVHGELEASHALAAMPLAATLGLGSLRCECVTGLVLNLHGNAITLSTRLWKQGVRDGASLRQEVFRLRHEKRFTFGVVARFSSHHFLMRKWLAGCGIDPVRDVRIVVVPPPQMAANLKAGHLDGFCVGEPWNSVAAQTRAGWCVAASAELAPGHPEKVLMARRDFAEKRAEEHVALLAALLEACEHCQQPENHAHLLKTLARPEYVGVPEAALRSGISGEMDFGQNAMRTVRNFALFHGADANEPSDEKIAWVLDQLRATATGFDASGLNAALGRRVFSREIFQQASLLRDSTRTENSKSNSFEVSTTLAN
jgi:ABC-type nitrate/sulfonate/bicarbonate transport system substrate-binding protein